MTIRELIANLEDSQLDHELMVSGYEGDWDRVDSIRHATVK